MSSSPWPTGGAGGSCRAWFRSRYWPRRSEACGDRRKADRLEQGARWSAVAPVGDTAAAMLGVHRGRRLRQWRGKGEIRALVVLTATFSDHFGGSMSSIALFSPIVADAA